MSHLAGLLPIDNIGFDIHVVSPVAKLRLDFRAEDLTLGLAPSEDFANEAISVRFNTQNNIFKEIASEFFEFRVFGPRPDWNLYIGDDVSRVIRVTRFRRKGEERGVEDVIRGQIGSQKS